MPRTHSRLVAYLAANLFVLAATPHALPARARAADGAAPERIRLAAGEIEGIKRKDGVRVFQGIPFAQPPVGDLRWKPPQPVKPWEGVKKATAFGPAPIQEAFIPSLIGVPKEHSEDCLYLNVWTPAKRADDKLPVMVWIHGGAFAMGSASQPGYDGSRLAERGVVVVSVGYRVGPFGFLAHPELTKEGAGSSGNYGLRDMVAGLEWVRDNATAFGGDPGCVTIFGESAGGAAVNILATCPKAKGMFHRAICQSGPGFTPPRTEANEAFHTHPTLAVAENEGKVFLTRVKAKDIATARALSADAVLKGGSGGSATIDGDVLPGDQYEHFKAGNFNDTPVLVGSNSDDGGMFVLLPVKPTDFVKGAKGFGEYAEKLLAVYPHATQAEATRSAKDLVADVSFRWPAWTWAKLQTEKGKGKAFVYFFDHPRGGASHAAEIPYVFGNPPPPGLLSKPWKAEDTKLSDLMGSYWVNFAKTGDPNGEGLPEWPAFTTKTTKLMTFDASPGMKDALRPERVEAFDAYFAWRRGQAKK